MGERKGGWVMQFEGKKIKEDVEKVMLVVALYQLKLSLIHI